MRAAYFTGLGDPSIMTIIDVPARDPGPREVQIRVTSAGLNRADANYRRGRYLVKSPGQSRSGFEGAGIVAAVGNDVREWKVGDRVAVLPSSFDVVHEGTCADADDGRRRRARRDAGERQRSRRRLDLDAVPHCLGRVGRDRRDRAERLGDRAGGVELGRDRVDPALSRARRQGHRDHDLARQGRSSPPLRAPTRSSTRRPSRTSNACRRSPAASGARVVFDPIYGPIVNDHIRVACREAIVFVYGALDATPLELGLGGMLRKQIRLQGYTLGPLLGDPARRARAIREITALLEGGDFTPVVDSYFPLDRIQDAHRHLESNQQIGKVVVTP